MLEKNIKIHIYLRKFWISMISLLVLIFQIPNGNTQDFSYYSNILREQNIIMRDFSSDAPMKRYDALSILIGLKWWPEWCWFVQTISCDIETIARNRGLISSNIDNTSYTFFSRAKALMLILDTKGIKATGKILQKSDWNRSAKTGRPEGGRDKTWEICQGTILHGKTRRRSLHYHRRLIKEFVPLEFRFILFTYQ